MGEPICIRHAVGICKSDDLAGGCSDPDIAGFAEPFVFLVYEPNVRIAFSDLPGAVGLAIVHNNNFVIWVVEFFQRRETCVQGALTVVHAYNHRHFRIGRKRRWQGPAVVLLDCRERWFLLPMTIDQSKGPILHLKSLWTRVSMPIISPGKNHRARDSRSKASAQLPGQSFGLKLAALSDGIDADFRQDQRPVAV